MISQNMQQDADARQAARMARVNTANEGRQGPPLPAPLVPVAIADYDGLLPAQALQADLVVKIPQWSSEGASTNDKDTVELRLEDGDGVLKYITSRLYTYPFDPDAFPTPIEIPQADIPAQGTYLLKYTVHAWNNNPSFSSPTPIIVDRQPPYYNPGHPATPAAIIVPVDVVTDQYLAENENELVCTLPGYLDKARGDQVSVYLGLDIPEGIDVVPVVGPIDVPDDLQIHIPGSAIQQRADGKNHILYWLNDKAGNFSDISVPAEVDVQLGVMPGGLQPPEVPLDPISRLDALAPVEVEIPAFTGPDKVTIKAIWGETPLPELKPGPAPQFPLRIGVPWSTLKNEYDFTGQAAQTVRVSYQAWRGPLAFPEAGPLFKNVQVDLSLVGPVNPDEPDPVNPDLPAVHLTSSTGQRDKLTVADKGQPAKANVPLHEFPVNEEIIELYWRDVVVDQFTVNGQTEGYDIEFNIMWEELLAGGNDVALPMTYTIRGKDSVNYQRSPTTPVDVDIVTIDLAKPTFPTIDPAVNIINCSSLDCGTQALQVHIPGNSTHLNDGDEIRLDSQGFDNSGNPVSGTEFSLNYTLQPGEAASGVTLRIQPYADHVLPIVNGRIVARYTAEIGGTPIDSQVANERVSLTLGGGGTCPIRPC